MNDLISVVIPTYNRRDKLPACIASVLAQTYRNIEVIVVDDASTDGTERLFDRDTDPRVHYVRYGDNRGACYARNPVRNRHAAASSPFRTATISGTRTSCKSSMICSRPPGPICATAA